MFLLYLRGQKKRSDERFGQQLSLNGFCAVAVEVSTKARERYVRSTFEASTEARERYVRAAFEASTEARERYVETRVRFAIRPLKNSTQNPQPQEKPKNFK